MRVSGIAARLALLLPIAGFSCAGVAGGLDFSRPDPYHLGQGLKFPDKRLSIGGYATLEYTDLKQQEWRLSAKTLSLFLSKAVTNRWHLFSEVEIGDAVQVSRHDISSSDADFDLERLYADYHARRGLNVRLGKYLTPVGRWNLIHADPLVWTTDRPLTTSAAFARHATGAMLYGDVPVGDNNLDYKLYIDDSQALDPDQKNERAYEDDTSGNSPRNAFKRAAGGRIAFHFMDDNVELGASYLRSKMSGLQDDQELVGADAFIALGRMELSAEWVYRNSLGSDEPDEHGGFVQAVLPLPYRLYLVGRREKYRAAALPPTATIDVVGITWRPHQAVSVKLEYRNSDNNKTLAPSGWLGSVAVLF